jgi:hypothetical protein
MHLLIPFASAVSEAGTQALRDLVLPHMTRLLSRLSAAARAGGDEYSLTPPHERALADALGWHGDDGALPWAARQAAADGVAPGDAPWALLTPVHWHVGRDHISLADPAALHLADAESRALLDAVRALFETEGFVLAWGAATRWYASHPSFDALPCASLDRVIGRNVDPWLPAHPQARLIRRLQNEVQMLLYSHPINDAREARGELAVNSFWVSGCGRRQGESAGVDVQVDDRLRAPALAEDWADWADAWRGLDAGPVAELEARTRRSDRVSLTLCGERRAERFDSASRPVWQRLARTWKSTPAHVVLEAL